MKNYKISDDDLVGGDATDANSVAAAAFAGLKGAIHTSVFQLRKGLDGEELPESTPENKVMTHLAIISNLLEVRHGEGSENVLSANPGNALDLDAARQEIGSRLAKLIEQRGS